MKIVGLEVANSSIKLYTHIKNSKGQEERVKIVYPNTTRVIPETEIKFALFNNENNVFKFNGVNYEVGLATNAGSGARSDNRYESDNFRMEAAFALARIVTEPNEQIKIVTGLPADKSKNQAIKDTVKNRLLGSYEVYVGDSKRTFEVTHVEVIAQPLGTLLSHLFTVTGEEKVAGGANRNTLVIDIGWGTTDVVVFDEFKVKERDTIQLAMSDYNRRLTDKINLEIPKTKLSGAVKSLYHLDELLRKTDELSLPTGTFNVRTQKADVKRGMASEIYRRLGIMGYNFDNFHDTLLSGGGATSLEDYLLPEFNDERVVVVDDAQNANVIGFYIYGCSLYNEA